jgi:hypothetical protein
MILGPGVPPSLLYPAVYDKPPYKSMSRASKTFMIHMHARPITKNPSIALFMIAVTIKNPFNIPIHSQPWCKKNFRSMAYLHSDTTVISLPRTSITSITIDYNNAQIPDPHKHPLPNKTNPLTPAMCTVQHTYYRRCGCTEHDTIEFRRYYDYQNRYCTSGEKDTIHKVTENGNCHLCTG